MSYSESFRNNVPGTDSGAPEPTYRDWREERRAWRREWREHRHGFPCYGLFWGLGLLLLGIMVLLNQTGVVTGDTWWQSLLIGLGAISIVNGLVHYANPAYRWGAYSKFVLGIILILIGALLMVGFAHWWPVVLIVGGITLLARFFWR
jgi:hypothetical protein